MKTDDFYRIEEPDMLTICYGVYTTEKAMRYRDNGCSFTVFNDHLEAILGNCMIVLA